MKCSHCDNEYLDRYKFIFSTIIFKNNNSIKCNQCNKQSSLNNNQVFSLRILFIFTIVTILYVISSFNDYNYNSNLIGVFSMLFFIIIGISTFMPIKKDIENFSKPYINKFNIISNLLFFIVYISVLSFFLVITYFMDDLLVELEMGFILGFSLTLILSPFAVTIVMYNAYPEKIDFFKKILTVKKYILLIIVLLLVYRVIMNEFDEEFNYLNDLYFISLPTIFSLLFILYVEKHFLTNGKVTYLSSLYLLIITCLISLTSMFFYFDKDEYYFNIERNGMTLANKIQQQISNKELDKIKIDDAIKSYESNL